MSGSHSVPQARVLWCLSVLTLSAVALGTPAAANPLPECAVVVHVQAWDPGFCDNHPVGQCEDATQYSELEGDMEFDLFLDNPYSMLPAFSEVTMTAAWPAAWQFTSFESCSGGSVTLTPGAQQLEVQLDYASPLQPGGWTYLGRFRMQVSGFGALGLSALRLDGGIWGQFGPAQAGVECTYSFLDCHDLMTPCSAHVDADAIEVHVPQEGTALETFAVWRGWDGMYPCAVQFLESADWMEVDVAWDQYGYQGVMTVAVNAAGLSPGTYPAVIRVASQIVTCIPVTVFVEPVAAAPDSDPTVRATSWGGLKQTYR